MSHQEFFQEIRKDHRELTDLLQQMKSQSSYDAKDMVVQLKSELKPHQEAEEKTFYQSLRRLPDAHRLAFKAEEEHHVAESILSDLEKTPSGDTWTAKLDVLDELVQEHIKEEESKAFKWAGSINETEMGDILRNFQSMKLRLKSDMMGGTTSGPDTTSGDLPNADLGQVV